MSKLKFLVINEVYKNPDKNWDWDIRDNSIADYLGKNSSGFEIDPPYVIDKMCNCRNPVKLKLC